MTQSRIKNTTKNLIYTLLLQIVKVILVFITRIIFVRSLGATYLGINGLFSNILGILSLADLGMTPVLMYSLYKPLAENNEIKILQYINFFKKVYNIIALTIAIVGLAMIPFIKYLVNLPKEVPNIYLYYILLLINTVLTYLFVYKTTLLSTDQKMYIINKYDIIFQIILFVFQVIILLIWNSFTLYLIANVTCTLIGNIFKVRATEKIYPYLKKNIKNKLSKEERGKIFDDLYSMFFYKIGLVIQDNTDNILTSILVGTIIVGYYSNYSTIIIFITTFLSLVFTSIKASVGNYIAFKDEKEQFEMFNMLEVYNFWLVTFCSSCFFVLISDFINICYGQEYILNKDILICIVLNLYISNIMQTLWMYRETTGIFKKTKYITLITSIINLILSIIFGKLMGLLGIIMATVISKIIYSCWREPMIILKKYFKTSCMPYFIKHIKRFIIFLIICFITYVIGDIIPIKNIYVKFMIKACICLVIPNIILLLIYRKNKAIIYLKDNLISKVSIFKYMIGGNKCHKVKE